MIDLVVNAIMMLPCYRPRACATSVPPLAPASVALPDLFGCWINPGGRQLSEGRPAYATG
jgi:hypothetical protein